MRLMWNRIVLVILVGCAILALGASRADGKGRFEIETLVTARQIDGLSLPAGAKIMLWVHPDTNVRRLARAVLTRSGRVLGIPLAAGTQLEVKLLANDTANAHERHISIFLQHGVTVRGARFARDRQLELIAATGKIVRLRRGTLAAPARFIRDWSSGTYLSWRRDGSLEEAQPPKPTLLRHRSASYWVSKVRFDHRQRLRSIQLARGVDVTRRVPRRGGTTYAGPRRLPAGATLHFDPRGSLRAAEFRAFEPSPLGGTMSYNKTECYQGGRVIPCGRSRVETSR